MNISNQDRDKNVGTLKRVGVGVAASGLAGLPSSVASIPIALTQGKRMSDIVLDSDAPKLTRSPEIKSLQKSMGTSVPVYRRSMGSIRGGGGAYDPFGQLGGRSGAVHTWTKSPKRITPFEMAVTSHELGHSKNWGGWKKYPLIGIRTGGMVSASLGSLGAAFAKKDETARKAAIAGSVLPGAMFAEEMLASARGFKGLAKHYGGGLRGWGSAFLKGRAGGLRALGLTAGTYGAVAATPALTYLLRKRMLSKNQNVKTAEDIYQEAFHDEIEKISERVHD